MSLTLLAVLAHPDDESLGIGGTLAKYAAEGVRTALVTATRGQGGRYRGHRDGPDYPGPEALGRIREDELRRAAAALGVGDLTILDHQDTALDRADPRRVVGEIAAEIRRLRPDVVVTFPPDGAYGHPDHIAISQFAHAAVVAAAGSHVVRKFYYMAWPGAVWRAYLAAFERVVATVDGVERQATAWPDWAVTTVIDARAHWPTVWRAVSCHESQISAYARLKDLSPDHHEALWGSQAFYRSYSLVNGGRTQESDLFEGLRG